MLQSWNNCVFETETTVFLKWKQPSFWVVTTMDLSVTTIHQLASAGSCIFITTYCYSVQLFHFTVEKFLINQQQWHCKCMHNKTASHSLTWSFSVTEHLILTSVGNVSLLRCKITTTHRPRACPIGISADSYMQCDWAILSLRKKKIVSVIVCTINFIICTCSSQLNDWKDRWK